MTLSESFLPEFDQEMAITRKMLERFPEEKAAWKPHDKSMSLGRLAHHVAEIPGWTKESLTVDELDMRPVGAPPPTPQDATSRTQLLELFDKNVEVARGLLSKLTDKALTEPWSLLSGGQKLFTIPRGTVLRTWVLNHAVHHRAQLGVYYRLNDVPVPATYGPSADEM